MDIVEDTPVYRLLRNGYARIKCRMCSWTVTRATAYGARQALAAHFQLKHTLPYSHS